MSNVRHHEPNQTMRRIIPAVLFAVAAYADAASIGIGRTDNGRNLSGILIEGQIVAGDFEKFQSQVLRRENIDPVWLASPGGDVVEAMKIGELVRELKLSVWAPSKNGLLFPTIGSASNSVCASACFYIYAAGVQRRGEVVGIHRPYFSPSALSKSSLNEAANAQAAALELSRAFLARAGVPASIVERIGTIASDKISWLAESDLATLNGFIPEFDEWFRAKCATSPNTRLPTSHSERAECEMSLLEQEQGAARFRWLLRTAPRTKP